MASRGNNGGHCSTSCLERVSVRACVRGDRIRQSAHHSGAAASFLSAFFRPNPWRDKKKLRGAHFQLTSSMRFFLSLAYTLLLTNEASLAASSAM